MFRYAVQKEAFCDQ